MDWSFKNLKGKAMGLLTDPQQQMGLLQNPLFSAGMGLLSSSYDPNVNPFNAAMGGIASAQQNQQAQADRERIEELRRQLAALIAGQGGGMQMPPGTIPGVDPQNMMQAPGGAAAGGGGGGGYVDRILQEQMWRNVLKPGGTRNA